MLSVIEYGESGQLMVARQELQPRREFDSYLLQPQGTTYREDGSLHYRWQAERANRLNSGDIVLHGPHYVGLREEQRNWQADARRGTLSADGQRLSLHEDVVIRDFLHNAKIASPALTVDMGQNRLYTEEPVRFSTPDAVTTAVGMRADINSERVEFQARVRGRYEGL